MKKLYGNIIIIFVLALSVLLVGCGEITPSKKDYNEANYTMDATFTFEKELTLDEAKQALAQAAAYFKEAKSYSYTQTLTGEYDSQYNYQGTTKIDVTGATPKASIELTGTTEYAFYIADNKAYFNYNGYKTYYEISSDLSDLVEKTQQSLGAFVSFDEASLTQESLLLCGTDDSETTVIKFKFDEETTVMVVINEQKIMKVLYVNDDAIEYVSKYDYNPVTVTLPSDLDSYVKK